MAYILDINGSFKDAPIVRKWLLAFTIFANLAMLVYFKYTNFFMANDGMILLNMLMPKSLEVSSFAQIALPLGISFFTFQAMSYVIDVYRGTTSAAKSFIQFSCYLTMFPQLVAGLIVRYTDIAQELQKRNISSTSFSEGAERFILGLLKKVFIADTLGRFADAVFATPIEQLPADVAWFGLLCYTLQIYFDFSGYSDMAIGIGRMLGFSFPENFNYPYISQSIQEFWRRWHMTLSGWFRDYLYIPLGGNRKGNMQTVFNLIIVFALCGLWHGAEWVFLAWGLYHGLLLVFERCFPTFLQKLPRIFRHAYTIIAFSLGWLIFRSENFTQLIGYCEAMLGYYTKGLATNKALLEMYSGDVILATIIGCLLATPIFPTCKKILSKCMADRPNLNMSVLFLYRTFLLVMLCFCILPLFGATYNAFIYFRF